MPHMAMTLHRPIVLVGMMGAGKTAVGKAMAGRLDVPFRDTDEALEAAANRTIAEIFERDGEAFFRDRETEVLARLLSEAPSVLSTGGGAFMSERNRDLIDQKAISVWLKADLDLLWSRVKHKTTRPLLRTENPRQTLQEIARTREPVYAKAAMIVDAEDDLSIEDMADKVIGSLSHAGDVVECAQ